MKELEELGGGVHQLSVPCDILTDRERKRYHRPNHELIRYLQYWDHRLACKPTNQQADTTETATATTTTTAPSAIKQFAGEQDEGECGRVDELRAEGKEEGGIREPMGNRARGHPSSRFACGLLSTLLDYVKGAMSTAREDKPSRVFSRHQNLTETSKDMKL
ncbi:unnamed protein product [Taenia asiatica]|uniref:Uncharacterized protein n=1 Tax=Taenia asiatica TaxID=60517 RepID=A0A0R3W084_TAEAS|nr:unnamed protein product [Taenia asiatica]